MEAFCFHDAVVVLLQGDNVLARAFGLRIFMLRGDIKRTAIAGSPLSIKVNIFQIAI